MSATVKNISWSFKVTIAQSVHCKHSLYFCTVSNIFLLYSFKDKTPTVSDIFLKCIAQDIPHVKDISPLQCQRYSSCTMSKIFVVYSVKIFLSAMSKIFLGYSENDIFHVLCQICSSCALSETFHMCSVKGIPDVQCQRYIS